MNNISVDYDCLNCFFRNSSFSFSGVICSKFNNHLVKPQLACLFHLLDSNNT